MKRNSSKINSSINSIKIAVVLLFLLFNIGCQNKSEKLIENGKRWKIIASTFGSGNNEIIDFDSDGSFTWISEKASHRGTYTTEGDSIKMLMDGKEEFFNGKFFFVDNKLKMEEELPTKIYFEMIEIK